MKTKPNFVRMSLENDNFFLLIHGFLMTMFFMIIERFDTFWVDMESTTEFFSFRTFFHKKYETHLMKHKNTFSFRSNLIDISSFFCRKKPNQQSSGYKHIYSMKTAG